MEGNLENSDVRLIIRNLITFIVVEGKHYVSDHQKKAYVSGYIHLLAKTIHLINEENEQTLIEDIANDITKYLK